MILSCISDDKSHECVKSSEEAASAKVTWAILWMDKMIWSVCCWQVESYCSVVMVFLAARRKVSCACKIASMTADYASDKHFEHLAATCSVGNRNRYSATVTSVHCMADASPCTAHDTQYWEVNN